MESEPKEDPLTKAPQQAPEQFKRIKIDTYVGMAFSNLIAYFIILTAAAPFMHTEKQTLTVPQRLLKRSDPSRVPLQHCSLAWE